MKFIGRFNSAEEDGKTQHLCTDVGSNSFPWAMINGHVEPPNADRLGRGRRWLPFGFSDWSNELKIGTGFSIDVRRQEISRYFF